VANGMIVYSPDVAHLCTTTTPASFIERGRLKRYAKIAVDVVCRAMIVGTGAGSGALREWRQSGANATLATGDDDLFRDPAVCRVMMIVAQEQAEEVQKREARRLEARKQQAQAALEHSKLRQLRAHRLSGLKVSTAPSFEMAKG